MSLLLADILSRFSLATKPEHASRCTCSELRIDPKFYRIANLDTQKWVPSAISPNASCSLCQAVRWMFDNTPGSENMRNASARGTNLLFQARPRIDRLTFEFSIHGGFPGVKNCPYSLVPICEGTQARLIEDTAFDPELVQSWLRDCDSNHDCVDRQEARDSRFELRVIDVWDLCVVEAPEVCRYGALSYVWGTHKQPLLKRDNLEQLADKGSLSSLPIPQTIKDAMNVCQVLNLRYLWVDSLCIIQDSNEHAAGQIAHMYNIYREAYITIVVAAGSDCAFGIPSIQPRPSFPSAAVIDQVKFAVVPHLFDAIEYRVQRSTWNQRCWTMQESALSRRRLVFTSHEYFLSCDEGLYTEALAGKLLQPHRSSVPPFPKLVAGKTLTAADGRRADLMYSRIVSLYVGRELTYPEDILRAFEGMANALTPLLGPFQWGHPHRLFRYAMCWSNHARLNRRDGFPSWSWTGWHHPHRQRQGSTSAVALSTWPFLFPGFGVTEMWPHCSVYLWHSSTAAKRFDHTRGLLDREWPAKPRISGALGVSVAEFLKWSDDDDNADFSSISTTPNAIFTSQLPGLPNSLQTINLSHIISFRSAIACFENTWFSPKDDADTFRSYVMDMELMEPRFHATSTGKRGHRLRSHSEAGGGISEEEIELIFVGQLQHHVVVLPVQVDAQIPPDDSSNSQVQTVLARRQGNPFRVFNDVWYRCARRCIVHLW